MNEENKKTEEIIDLDDEALEKVTGGVNVYPEDDEKKEEDEAASGKTTTTNHNMSSLAGIMHQNNKSGDGISKNLEKLTAGAKINTASVDPNGKLNVQILFPDQKNSNVKSDNAILSVAEDAVNSTIEILRVLKAKVTDATNSEMSAAERSALQSEIAAALAGIDNNAAAEFNGRILFDGSGISKCQALPNVFWGLEGSQMTENTPLTDLTDKNGENAGIEETDNLTVSLMYRGETYSGTATVGNMSFEAMRDMVLESDSGSVRMGDILYFTNADITLDSMGLIASTGLRGGILCSAANEGMAEQISAFCMQITDRNGEMKSAANSILDTFSEICAARNANSTDNSVVIPMYNGKALKVDLYDMSASALGLVGENGSIDVSNAVNAAAAAEAIETAMTRAVNQELYIEAVKNRLEITSNNLTANHENSQPAEPAPGDTDMAKEMVNYTKGSILQEAAQAMLAQTDRLPQDILNLLQ